VRKTNQAARRLAKRSRPRAARTRYWGSRAWDLRSSLKFLGIVDTHAEAVEGFVLGRRLGAEEGSGAEGGGVFEPLEELDDGFGGLGADDHVELDDVVGGEVGADGDEADATGEDLFEVLEEAGPTDAFAEEEGIDEGAAVDDGGVGGLAELGFEAGLLGHDGAELGLDGIREVAAFASGLAFAEDDGDLEDEDGDEEEGGGGGGDEEGAVASEGLAGEIEGDARVMHVRRRPWIRGSR
jgi:hypothetical protein